MTMFLSAFIIYGIVLRHTLVYDAVLRHKLVSKSSSSYYNIYFS